jgi:Essential protein Yae1, N terminal
LLADQAGYREGITAGKEGALQEGFDSGFEQTGAPIGRRVGRARGMASALLTLFNDQPAGLDPQMAAELRTISNQLSDLRFSDIVPPDLEAEEHEREHRLANGEDLDVNEEIQARNDVENLEDMLVGMGSNVKKRARPAMQDFETALERLSRISTEIGLDVQFA